jgi:MraZ protein
MFVGQFEHSLDDKNRLVLPARFRSQLSSTVYLNLDLDKCLSVYSEDSYKEKAKKIAALDEFDPTSRSLKRVFFANSAEVPLDKQGRLLIQDFLLKKAGITKDVIVIGAFDHLQIFAKESFEAKLPDEEENYEKLAAEVKGEGGHGI